MNPVGILVGHLKRVTCVQSISSRMFYSGSDDGTVRSAVVKQLLND